jgi:hypothetical protein
MAERETTLNEVLFIGLILNLQASAMIALGKLTNPMTQKVERNLEQARITIDMLGMLEEKTKGNCTDEETKTLQKALTELRMNYLDELKKDHAELEKQEAEKEAKEAKGTEKEKKAEKAAEEAPPEAEEVKDAAESGGSSADAIREQAEKQHERKGKAAKEAGGKKKDGSKKSGGRKSGRKTKPRSES